jgi:hypothetical protein
MKFRNLKTCQGLETHLFWNGSLLRLSLVPELLRSLPRREAMELVDLLVRLEAIPPGQAVEIPVEALELLTSRG